MQKRIVVTVLALCMVGLLGCGELKELRKQNASLRSQLESCETEKAAREEEVQALAADREVLQARIAETEAERDSLRGILGEVQAEEERRQAELAELQQVVRDMRGFSIEQRPEGNFILMPSEILFELGKTDLNEGAKESLDGIVEYLRDHPGVNIRIDGHTDGVPIKVSGYEDNHHLGAMRAHSVMTYLRSKGISGQRMYIASFGPNSPEAPPPAPEAPMAENRRVEILLLPGETTSSAEMLGAFGS